MHTVEVFGGNQGQVGKAGLTRRGRKTAKTGTSTSQRVTPLRSQGQTDIRPQNMSPFESRELGIKFGKGCLVDP